MVFNVTSKDITQFSSLTVPRKHQKWYHIGINNSGVLLKSFSSGKSTYDDTILKKQSRYGESETLQCCEQNAQSIPAVTTFTKSFPDDEMDEKLCRERRNKIIWKFIYIERIHIYIYILYIVIYTVIYIDYCVVLICIL